MMENTKQELFHNKKVMDYFNNKDIYLATCMKYNGNMKYSQFWKVGKYTYFGIGLSSNTWYGMNYHCCRCIFADSGLFLVFLLGFYRWI